MAKMAKNKAKSKAKSSSSTSTEPTELKVAPKAPFILIFVGGIIILFGGIVIMTMASVMFTIMRFVNFAMFSGAYSATLFFDGALSILCGLLIIMASILTNTRNIQKIKVWSMLGLAFDIVSLLAFGGFIIGFAITLLGALAGMYVDKK